MSFLGWARCVALLQSTSQRHCSLNRVSPTMMGSASCKFGWPTWSSRWGSNHRRFMRYFSSDLLGDGKIGEDNPKGTRDPLRQWWWVCCKRHDPKQFRPMPKTS